MELKFKMNEFLPFPQLPPMVLGPSEEAKTT